MRTASSFAGVSVLIQARISSEGFGIAEGRARSEEAPGRQPADDEPSREGCDHAAERLFQDLPLDRAGRLPPHLTERALEVPEILLDRVERNRALGTVRNTHHDSHPIP